MLDYINKNILFLCLTYVAIADYFIEEKSSLIVVAGFYIVVSLLRSALMLILSMVHDERDMVEITEGEEGIEAVEGLLKMVIPFAHNHNKVMLPTYAMVIAGVSYVLSVQAHVLTLILTVISFALVTYSCRVINNINLSITDG